MQAIDSKKAQATVPADDAMIKTQIVKELGGHKVFDRKVQDALQATWAGYIAHAELSAVVAKLPGPSEKEKKDWGNKGRNEFLKLLKKHNQRQLPQEPMPCKAKSIDLQGMEVTEKGEGMLAQVVSRVPAFTLEHAIMTDFCGIPLVSLRENSITELDLKSKGVGVPGAIVLSKLLPSAVALRSLNLADNELCGVDSDGYGTYTAEGINKLCDGLKGSAVTLLNLQGNYIGAIGAVALAAFLKETPITELDVGSNHLTDNGLLKLVQILPQTKIESLGIGSNRIGDKGASALAAILKETKITTLELGDNNIGGQYDKKCQFVSNTEGIIALCEGLKGSSVTSLDLAHSALCNEAKQALEDTAGSSLRISF